jgi:hypothetical protein
MGARWRNLRLLDILRCEAACTATSCPAGQRCGTSGHCETAPCGAGYTCPSDHTCTPGAGGPDDHGCVPTLCTAGYPCPSGSACQVGAAGVDRHGCLGPLCTGGDTCPSNQICCRLSSSADRHGAWPPHAAASRVPSTKTARLTARSAPIARRSPARPMAIAIAIAGCVSGIPVPRPPIAAHGSGFVDGIPAAAPRDPSTAGWEAAA